MQLEVFGENLRARAATIYRRMDAILDELDTPEELRRLKLTGPERVAFAALGILETEIGKVLRGEAVDDEAVAALNLRYGVILDSPAKQSGQAKVDQYLRARSSQSFCCLGGRYRAGGVAGEKSLGY